MNEFRDKGCRTKEQHPMMFCLQKADLHIRTQIDKVGEEKY